MANANGRETLVGHRNDGQQVLLPIHKLLERFPVWCALGWVVDVVFQFGGVLPFGLASEVADVPRAQIEVEAKVGTADIATIQDAFRCSYSTDEIAGYYTSQLLVREEVGRHIGGDES